MAKKIPTKDEVLVGLVKWARPIMLSVVNHDSCIAMTRCAIEVLRVFGFEAYPMNAEMIVVNKKFCELADAGKIEIDGPIPKWAIDEGAWSVGIGVNPKPHEGGHVVAILDNKLIDLSVDQATRRLKNIVLRPMVIEINPEEQAQQLLTDDGVLITWALRKDLRTWQNSPDWKRYQQRYWKQAALIIRNIREELPK